MSSLDLDDAYVVAAAISVVMPLDAMYLYSVHADALILLHPPQPLAYIHCIQVLSCPHCSGYRVLYTSINKYSPHNNSHTERL
jgi:hypothetical protein